MSLGVRYAIGEIKQGDTAPLKAALRERDRVVPADEIGAVTFQVQLPNGSLEEPFDGEVEENGEGTATYEETEEVGEYLVRAQFTLLSGEIRSVMVNFDVVDPFSNKPTRKAEIVTEDVWMRLEDCFDAFEGGPYVRDETLAHFDERKIARFIPEVILDINVQEPKTKAVLGDFVSDDPHAENPVLPLLSKGVLCKSIMHLVRSYAEIPVPQGGQVVYEDRTRYAQIWQTIYKTEHEDYYTMVRLWKRGFLNYGHSALLVSSKAGRLFFGPMMRTRNVGRGWY